MAIKSSDMTMIVVGCAVVAAIVGGILNCFVLPIGYIITHDCGKWICNHNYPVTWGSYAIVTGIVFLFLLFIAIIGESSNNNGTTTVMSVVEEATNIEGEITIIVVGKPTITIVIWKVHQAITASIKMEAMLFRSIRHIKN